MAGSGGQHFDGLDQIGLSQTVATHQNVHAWYEIDHYLAPGAVVVERETGDVHWLSRLM